MDTLLQTYITDDALRWEGITEENVQALPPPNIKHKSQRLDLHETKSCNPMHGCMGCNFGCHREGSPVSCSWT